MELSSGVESLGFRALQSRLLALVNARIRNGEFSERGLALLLGISQPHLHNVLKGERKLHAPLADILLAKFGISVTDLLQPAEWRVQPEAAEEPAADLELARLRLLRKRPASYRTRDRSEWNTG